MQRKINTNYKGKRGRTQKIGEKETANQDLLSIEPWVAAKKVLS